MSTIFLAGAANARRVAGAGMILLNCWTMPLLFSYGTLQQENVQMAVFGRLLHGQKDELVGFEQALIRIEVR